MDLRNPHITVIVRLKPTCTKDVRSFFCFPMKRYNLTTCHALWERVTVCHTQFICKAYLLAHVNEKTMFYRGMTWCLMITRSNKKIKIWLRVNTFLMHHLNSLALNNILVGFCFKMCWNCKVERKEQGLCPRVRGLVRMSG